MNSIRRKLITFVLPALGMSRARAADMLFITAVSKTGASGVAARLLAEIYRQAGLRLKIEVVPGARASLMTLSGQSDGDVIRIRSYGQNYPQLVRVDPAYYHLSVRAYSMPVRNATVRSLDDLQHYSLGAIRGVAYASELTENHPAVTLTQNSEQMFRMLQAGRIDLALDTTITAQSSMNKLRLKDVVESPELARFDFHHYLHGRHKDLALRIGDVIRKMKASGELDRLTAQYEAALANVEAEPAASPGASSPNRR